MLTEEHFEQLLGLRSPWSVTNVDLNMEKLRVDIYVEHLDQSDKCPECGASCRIYDEAAERTWRHLDTMQFETLLHAKTPRVECPKHGVKTVNLPWAEKHARFTLLFEAFAISVLQAARSVEEARKLLRLNWHQVETIKKRAVARGLSRRKQTLIPYIGLDEKSFRKGMSFVTTCCDLEGGCVLDVAENRNEKSAKTLLNKALSESQQAGVFAAAMDMWPAYRNAVNEVMPFTEIVHDRFHVSKHLNEAVDSQCNELWEWVVDEYDDEHGLTWRCTGLCAGQGSQGPSDARWGPCLGSSCCWFQDGEESCNHELSFNRAALRIDTDAPT